VSVYAVLVVLWTSLSYQPVFCILHENGIDKTYVRVLGSLVEHLDPHAELDHFLAVSDLEAVAWDRVLGHLAKLDFGWHGLGVGFGAGFAESNDWLLAESAQDRWVGDVKVDLIVSRTTLRLLQEIGLTRGSLGLEIDWSFETAGFPASR
jgi:hypothetical protein